MQYVYNGHIQQAHTWFLTDTRNHRTAYIHAPCRVTSCKLSHIRKVHAAYDNFKCNLPPAPVTCHNKQRKLTWPRVSLPQVYILSGRDGSVLFQTRSRPMSVHSDLSLKTKADASDLFLIRTIVTQVADKQRQVGSRHWNCG